MQILFNYVADNQIFFLILFGMMILIVILFGLYQKQRRTIRQIEQTVEDERNFYQSFEDETSHVYLCIRQSDLKILYISSNLYTVTGLNPESVYSDIEMLSALVSPYDARKIRKELTTWNQTDTLEQEINFHKLGSEQPYRGKLSLSAPADKDIYLLVFTDITNEYQLRETLYEQLDQVQKESLAKTDFLSRMSHEIRTPMNGILGMLNLAQKHIDDSTLVSQYLGKTENLSMFLLTLINDILDMSRIESGKMKLEEVPFDLTVMAAKIDNMFSGSAKEKGILWTLQLQNIDTPYVIGDEMRLSQVIINFISNALKFTPEHGEITVTFRQMGIIDDKAHLMLRVKDTGKGMKTGFLDKIFLPFEQEDASTAHNYGGSGLGMAIADNIIKLMHGEILVESEEGKGSEFVVYVSLPVAQENIDDLKNSASTASQTSYLEDQTSSEQDFTMEGLHILLAEDNDINAEIAIELLELDGAIVDQAPDGAKALEMFDHSIPGYYDVILMDIQMPNMDGWEATKAIRDLPRTDHDILIFAMSANAFVEDQRHSLEIGMNAHINKPIDFEELRQLIKANL